MDLWLGPREFRTTKCVSFVFQTKRQLSVRSWWNHLMNKQVRKLSEKETSQSSACRSVCLFRLAHILLCVCVCVCVWHVWLKSEFVHKFAVEIGGKSKNIFAKKKMTTISSMVSVPNLRRLSSRKVFHLPFFSFCSLQRKPTCTTLSLLKCFAVSLVKRFGYPLETEMARRCTWAGQRNSPPPTLPW